MKPFTVHLAGVALLPVDDAAGCVIDFQRAWTTAIAGPRLGLDTNLPHMSLYQFPCADLDRLADTAAALASPGVEPASFRSLAYQPDGWIFAHLETPAWVEALHHQALDVLSGSVHRPSLDLASQHGATRRELDVYRRYGYRYAADCFLPHITVGRTPNDETSISSDMADMFSRRFTACRIPFDRLVVYRAGPHGALVEIIRTL